MIGEQLVLATAQPAGMCLCYSAPVAQSDRATEFLIQKRSFACVFSALRTVADAGIQPFRIRAALRRRNVADARCLDSDGGSRFFLLGGSNLMLVVDA
jgi:hypothetical protein